MSEERVVTPEGRLIFDRYLFEPDTKKDKYSAAILIPKDEDFKQLQAMCMEVANAKWPKGLPEGMKLPVKDTKESSHEEHPHMKGMKILNAGTKFAIPVVRKVKGGDDVFITRDGIKAGDNVRFSVEAWAYDVDGNKGVALNLRAVLKVSSNEALTSKASASDMFKGFISAEETPKEEFNNFGF